MAGAGGAASTPVPIVDLAAYRPKAFERGRSVLVEAAWRVVQTVLAPLPGSAWRRLLLRAFGARIGTGVVVKPFVKITFPWRLTVGDHTWLGEGVWIDNLAPVTIGSHCCLSQDAMLCTGNHDWSSPGFDLVVRPITIEDGAWVAARACIGPGVTVGRGAVLALGAVAVRDLAPAFIHQGCPAAPIRPRQLGR
jgi:putative colanic acid biosynthesis acetyltransferase WcaF